MKVTLSGKLSIKNKSLEITISEKMKSNQLRAGISQYASRAFRTLGLALVLGGPLGCATPIELEKSVETSKAAQMLNPSQHEVTIRALKRILIELESQDPVLQNTDEQKRFLDAAQKLIGKYNPLITPAFQAAIEEKFNGPAHARLSQLYKMEEREFDQTIAVQFRGIIKTREKLLHRYDLLFKAAVEEYDTVREKDTNNKDFVEQLCKIMLRAHRAYFRITLNDNQATNNIEVEKFPECF